MNRFARSTLPIPLIISLVILLAAGDIAAFTDGEVSKKRRAESKEPATRRPEDHEELRKRLEEAEQRAQAAEQRAQEAESAAAKAFGEAKAAAEQAAQALEAARRSGELLSRMQETLARLEQTGGRNTEAGTAISEVDASVASGAKTVGATEAAAAKPPAQADQKIEGAVTSSSKFPVTIYGNLLLSTNYLDRGTNTIDIPLFAIQHNAPPNQNHQNFNMTLRQSRFGLRYERANIFKDAKLTGAFEFDLLGGKPDFPNGMNFDILRVRLAYGRLDWGNHSFEGGQDWTLFSPLNPTTLASYAIPGFSTSGNLWIRSPQIRYEHRITAGEKSGIVIAGAIVDPNAGDNVGNPASRPIGLGERGAMPAFETRIGFTAPTHEKESSGGVSGHYSRLLGVPGSPAGTTVHSPIDSYGVSGDWNLWFTSGLRVSGEIFHGRALGIFSGDIGQAADVITGRAHGITTSGGWAELHGEAPSGYSGWWKNFSANIGYGIEDNRNRDLLVGLRARNQSFMVNGQYRLTPNITFALEYRRIMTDYFEQPAADNKLNWGNLSFLYTF
jgi:uncharacterized membrane protein